MAKQTIEQQLNELREYRGAVKAMEDARDMALADVLTPEQRDRIDNIKADFDVEAAEYRQRINELEGMVKQSVINLGTSVKADGVTVSFVKASTRWDSKALEGYAAAHEELHQFRTMSQPSARIRYTG